MRNRNGFYVANFKLALIYIAIAIIMAIANQCFGQVKVEYNNGNPQYQKVIQVPDSSAAYLYGMANKWIGITYKSAKAVIVSSAENDYLKGNGAAVNGVKIAPLTFASLEYTFTIEIKDGRVRYTANPERVGNYGFSTYVFKSDGSIRTNSQATSILTSVDSIINSLITSLSNYLTNPQKEDW